MMNPVWIRKLPASINLFNLKYVQAQKFHKYVYTLSSILQSKYLNSLNKNQNIQYHYAQAYKFDSFLIITKRFYSDINRKEINLKIAKGKQIIAENLEQKRLRMRESKEILVKGIRDQKTKVQEKVKEMEEIVERENILTIPNFLCVTRSFLSPYIGYVIIQGDYNLAIGLLAFAGITDLLDGFIARNWKSQASKLGSFLDPMADKLLVGSLVISLSISNLFPVWLSAMIILRDFFLIIAGFVIRYISLPPPRTLSRFFDATHVTAKLKPTFTSKINTTVQLVTIAASLASPVYGLLDQTTLQGLWYITGFTTAAAAVSYIFTKNTYQLIKQRKNIKKDS